MNIRKITSQTVKINLTVILCALFSLSIGAQKRPVATISTQTRSITIFSEPNALIWIDDILRGKTDETGKLAIKNAPAGLHRLRIRANGFKEMSQNLTAVQRGEIKITLTPTTDEAEIIFQQAETQTDKQKAIELYRKTISLRPKYAEAYIGLARALSAMDEVEEALKAVADAKRARSNYAEASAIEGRIYSAEGNEIKAVAAYKRAILEGKGFQPEAHTGLALLYRDKAEDAGSSGDLQKEKTNLTLAANELSIAVKQLSGAPDAEILYQILGGIYEKNQDYKKAIAVYQEFLHVFPESSEASAVKSFIVQLRKQMNGEQ
jgi:tetratricopeptide (TPR) repeat protein